MKPEEKNDIVDKVLVERLHYLTDPVKRLQALEGALLASILFTLFSFMAFYFLSRTWLAVLTGFLFVNTLVILFRYLKERKEYIANGGEL